MFDIHRNFLVLCNNKLKRKKVSNIFSTSYKINYGTKSSRSGHCRSLPLSSLASYRDSHEKRSHEENILTELPKTLFSLANAGTIPEAKSYKVLAPIALHIVMTLKLLLNLRTYLMT